MLPEHVVCPESKSLWHLMAESLLLVNEDDRDRFVDFCLKRRIMCDESRFQGPAPVFQWRAGITLSNKVRQWAVDSPKRYISGWWRVQQCTSMGGRQS